MTSPEAGRRAAGPSPLLRVLDRMNAAYPWSHNALHARLVVREARRVRRDGGRTALDVGCGTGDLAVRLHRVLPVVRGVEADGVAAALARERTSDLPGVAIVTGRFPLDDAPADLVAMVAVLHHLPLREGLLAARAAVAPGGRLVIIGLAREDSLPDRVTSAVSVALNPFVGMVLHAVRGGRRVPPDIAPARPPEESTTEVRAALREVLPGVRIRRRLFWRYSAVWRNT